MNNRERWEENYKALSDYVLEYGHFPGKNQNDSRALLNWWKYNRKCVKLGRIDEPRVARLKALSELRVCKRGNSNVAASGRK